MSQSSDIKNLFHRFGGHPERYQELALRNDAQASLSRWPLLASIVASRASHPPGIRRNGHEPLAASPPAPDIGSSRLPSPAAPASPATPPASGGAPAASPSAFVSPASGGMAERPPSPAVPQPAPRPVVADDDIDSPKPPFLGLGALRQSAPPAIKRVVPTPATPPATPSAGPAANASAAYPGAQPPFSAMPRPSTPPSTPLQQTLQRLQQPAAANQSGVGHSAFAQQNPRPPVGGVGSLLQRIGRSQ